MTHIYSYYIIFVYVFYSHFHVPLGYAIYPREHQAKRICLHVQLTSLQAALHLYIDLTILRLTVNPLYTVYSIQTIAGQRQAYPTQ